MEEGESEQEAVVREVFEEVNLLVKPVRKLADFDTHDGSSRIHWWLVDVLQGEPILKNDGACNGKVPICKNEDFETRNFPEWY